MSEMHLFGIPRAYATWIKERLVVSLFYPPAEARQYAHDRTYSDAESLEFGIGALNTLNSGLQAPIATEKVPARPASAGVLDVLRDGRIVVHRRDENARVNPLHYGIPSGFPTEESHWYDIGLLARRESAEELVYVTRDRHPAIVIPVEGNEDYDPMIERITLQSAERLGLDTSVKKYEKVQFEQGCDEVEIYEHAPAQTSIRRFTRIGSTYGFVYLSWENEHSIVLAQMRHLLADPENILPIDAEGDYREGGSGHFNREVFVLDPEKLNGVGIGALLPEGSYKVYKFGRDERGGHTSVLQARLEHPPVLMPDDGVRRMLDELCVEGYRERWMELEIEREKKKLRKLTGEGK